MVLFDFEGVDLIYYILIISLAETIDSEIIADSVKR